jgi:hypothetical protein
VPATLAALPSTRAIETRSLPSSLAATHRGFAFYVAFPKRSIPLFATCSMSLIPQLYFSLIVSRQPPAALDRYLTAFPTMSQFPTAPLSLAFAMKIESKLLLDDFDGS